METSWYTGTGDDGYTGVLGRERVPKYANRPEAYGTVDEASAVLGLARAQAREVRTQELLLATQRDLHYLMADLATVPVTATRPPWLTSSRLDWLEACAEEVGANIQMPGAFIAPGDSLAGASLDVARTVVRRAERLVAKLTHDGEVRDDVPLKYLNRLSSLLFLLARLEDKAAGVERFTLASDERETR